MRVKPLDMLKMLLYWYDVKRSESFRKRACPSLWHDARELVRSELKKESRKNDSVR